MLKMLMRRHFVFSLFLNGGNIFKKNIHTFSRLNMQAYGCIYNKSVNYKDFSIFHTQLSRFNITQFILT